MARSKRSRMGLDLHLVAKYYRWRLAERLAASASALLALFRLG